MLMSWVGLMRVLDPLSRTIGLIYGSLDTDGPTGKCQHDY